LQRYLDEFGYRFNNRKAPDLFGLTIARMAEVCAMPSWWMEQYNDIKGNLKWALLGILWLAMTSIGKFLLAHYTNLPPWLAWAILLLASGIAFFWVSRSLRYTAATQIEATPGTSAAQMVASAALRPPMPSPIDVAAFFRESYSGQLQTEVEGNIRVMIQSRPPNERDEFVVKFIATGLINVVYERIWLTIFRSQLLALTELNRRLLRLEQLQPYYNSAAQGSPDLYANYSFPQWLNYMRSQVLILEHPGQTFEITVRGKDFLKYMVHCGYTPENRRY
jgi:hypothetical protein